MNKIVSKTVPKKSKAPKKKSEPEVELPIFKAVSMHKLDGMGNAGWVVLKFDIQGDKVINVEASEPNLRQIAIEELKIETVRIFFDPMGR